MHRREFIQSLSIAAGATIAYAASPINAINSFTGTYCLFSKHLPNMDWQRLAQTVKKLGFGGVDLTVRPRGHVLPERAVEDLPKAIAAIKAEGLTVPFITTELLSASDPTAKPILETAGKLKVPAFKPGYYKYAFQDVRRELEQAMKNFSGLAELAKQNGVQTGFHNHEGNIGAPIWDVAKTIDTLEAKWVGYYFDVRHAVVEGGVGGWKTALNLIAPRIKMIAVKDFYWEKSATGWKVVNCPLGEGMVDWKQYFRLLRQANFQGPISLHLEYAIPGKTPAEIENNTILAAQRDFAFLKNCVNEAFA